MFHPETRNRIKLAVAAYAYEIESRPIISDATFDFMALMIQPAVPTGNARLDLFFMTEFSPHTGQWIYRHPDLDGIRRIYRDWYAGTANRQET